jgi:cytochrome P450
MSPDSSAIARGPRTPAAWQLLRYSHSPLPFLEQCGRRYGDTFLVRLAGYGKLVMLTAPQAVQDVFRGDGYALHSGEGNAFLMPTIGPSSVRRSALSSWPAWITLMPPYGRACACAPSCLSSSV